MRATLVALIVVTLWVAVMVGAGYVLTPLPSPERPLTLIISGDTQGWIVPCGCAANQSGGLLRRGSYVANEQGAGETILVDAGGAPGGVSTYHRAKFEAIVEGELLMGASAHNLGGPEAALGADYLRELGQRLKAPFISANLRDVHGVSVAPGYRIVETAGPRILFVGVLSPKYATAQLRIDDPRHAVLDVLASVQGDYDSLVVLAYLQEEELRELAGRLPEADVIAGGPTGQSIAPTFVGPTLLTAATNKGKFLARLEHRPEYDVAGSWFGKIVEMGPEIADDPVQTTNLAKFHDRLAKLDLPASETGFVQPISGLLPESYRIAGSESCRKCHPADCKQWDTTKHALAWKTLQVKGYQVDAYCQQCHTTGYGLPGGFDNIQSSLDRVSVGCESCHGPSLAHNREPKTKTPFAAKDQCIRCHDVENSPKFELTTYWQRIAHGPQSAPANQSTRSESATPGGGP